MTAFRRVIWIVLDSVGIGEMPDAAEYGDAGSDTLGNIARKRPLRLPNLCAPGPRQHQAAHGTRSRRTAHGRVRPLRLASPGKDTTTGHWEMVGHPSRQAVPTLSRTASRRKSSTSSKSRIGRKTLGNCPASGTEIIQRLGDEHMRTGSPIVYTSADSVFQIAAHEEVIPVAELYRICEIAREMLRGEHEVGRVIARPFIGTLRRLHPHRQPPRLRRSAAARHAARPAARRGYSGAQRRQDLRRIPRPRHRRLGQDEINADGMAKTLAAMESTREMA